MWLLLKLLARTIIHGRLTLITADGTRHEFGTPHPDYPEIVMRFADAGVARSIVRNPRLGFGEAWIDGRIIIERGDIAGFLTLFRKNASWERAAKV